MGAKGRVHPLRGSQIKSVTEDEALARALADVGDEESGRADFAARRSGSIREPNERDTEKTEVGVDECDGLVEVDPRVRRVELPLGVLGVADGDPGAVDEIDLSREAFYLSCFEVKRIIGNQDCRIGPPLDLDAAANVVKQTVSGADVVVSFIGFEVLVAVIEPNVAGSGGFVGLAVVFDVIGAKTGVRVLNVHVAFSSGEVAFAALRFRF